MPRKSINFDAAGVDENDGFELFDRWIRVSPADFAETGNRGTPEGMIGSDRYNPVHGVIGKTDRGARWWLWSSLGAGALLLGAVAWVSVRASAGSGLADELAVAPARVVSVELEPASVEAAKVEAQKVEAAKVEAQKVEAHNRDAALPDSTTVPVPTSGRRRRARARHRSAKCESQRERADEALRVGRWEELERLALDSACWRRPSVAVGLRMRALFELDRHHECIELGAKSESKEIEKWASNCGRALR